MDKIIRYRNLQTKSLEDFVEEILKKPSCKYCSYHDECQEMMGMENIDEEFEGYGCTAFDNTVEDLTKLYLKEYSLVTT